MSDLRDLKAVERRKQVRKFIRQGLKEVEMAERLDVDYTTISEDVSIIQRENAHRTLAHIEDLEKDREAKIKMLRKMDEIDEECWKVYYGNFTIKEKDKDGKPTERTLEIPIDPKTKLEALDKLRQNNRERANILQKLNTSQQITIEQLIYVEKMIPVVLQKYTEIVLEYVPKEKQVELLDKLMAIDIEGTIHNGK